MKTFEQKRVVTLLSPNVSLGEALYAMDQTSDPALPVVGENGFVGVVLREDLMRYAPSPATSLSKWEMNFLLNDISVADEKLIRGVSQVEAHAHLDELIEAFRSSESPVIGVTLHGRFCQLLSWRGLLEEFWSERQAERRDLVMAR
ncbi:CBS domain-containing protein [Candidatus Acetothermia bacterium]|nr:CBS domain-containing protein [Candidatus Acetothermia bacterium]MBI3644071.1 CBS domain-containing protein [Candidatus Acetothermia bacterium]